MCVCGKRHEVIFFDPTNLVGAISMIFEPLTPVQFEPESSCMRARSVRRHGTNSCGVQMIQMIPKKFSWAVSFDAPKQWKCLIDSILV